MASTMRPGTDTGSLQNHLMSRMTKGAPEPEIGMGATILLWTDRKAATVIEWYPASGHIVVQADHVIPDTSKGQPQMGHQDWICTPDPKGTTHRFRRGKDGGWVPVRFNRETQRWNKIDGPGLLVGRRNHYHDWSF